MQYIINVTKKGQATIPAPFRRKLGIKPGEKVLFEEKGEEVMIKRVLTLEELKGSLKSKIKYDDRKADAAIAEMFRKEYAKKTG